MMLLTFFLASLGLLVSAHRPVHRNRGQVIPIYERNSSLVLPSGEVNLTRLRAELWRVQSKHNRNFERYESNYGKRHPLDARQVSAGVEKRAHAKTIIDDGGSNFYWLAQFGSMGFNLSLMLDTGSSDIIVPGQGCSNCGAHLPYLPGWSITSRATGVSFTSNFASASEAGASVKGMVYTDQVGFAGFKVAKQAFGVATSENKMYTSAYWDGIMGLAYPALTSYGSLGNSPYMMSLANQGSLDKPRFGFIFDVVTGNQGMYIGADPGSTIIKSIHWTKIQKPLAYWEIPITSIGFGTTKPVNNINAIIDTGATNIFGDEASVKKLYSHVPGSKDASSTVAPGYFTFPCDNALNLEFTFGTSSFSMPNTNPGFIQGFVPGSKTECIGSIAYHSASYWLVGLAFLRNVYSTFDLSGHQVGFAELIIDPR